MKIFAAHLPAVWPLTAVSRSLDAFIVEARSFRGFDNLYEANIIKSGRVDLRWGGCVAKLNKTLNFRSLVAWPIELIANRL